MEAKVSFFARIGHVVTCLVAKVGPIGFLALFPIGLLPKQGDSDRPHLSRRTSPIVQTDPVTDSPMSLSADPALGTPIGDGLILPALGHVWARDNFGGQSQLVQLKYVPTEVDRHAASNILKANIAPFVYKPKSTIEIQGAAANVRLRDQKASIYVRGFGIAGSEDAAGVPETSTQTDLTIVRVEVKKDRRIISTIAFTQITGKAARSVQTIALTVEKLGNTDWRKITPTEPLPPGEYVLMCMPRGPNLFPTSVFDFAIDPNAPVSQNVNPLGTATPTQ